MQEALSVLIHSSANIYYMTAAVTKTEILCFLSDVEQMFAVCKIRQC